MKRSILEFRFISVRDDWTKKMIVYLTDGEIVPEVTPDPVLHSIRMLLNLSLLRRRFLGNFLSRIIT